jgi:hypothetical protein
MDRDAYFAKNRKKTKSLADLQSEAEERVTKNPAYQGLIEDGRRTQAQRMINDARASAQKLYNEQQAETTGEDARLEDAYNKYKAGLKADLDAYFAGKASEEQAAKDRLANTPFRQRHPGWAEALPAIGFGLAAGYPFASRLTSNLMDQTAPRIDSAIQRARTTTDPREFQFAVDELNSALAARPQRIFDQSSFGNGAKIAAQAAWPAAKAGLIGGPVAAEFSMFPDQWDAINLPSGEAQRNARAAALNPRAYGERALLAGAAAAGGYKLPDLLPWPRRPNWAQAEAATKLSPPGGPGRNPGGGAAAAAAGPAGAGQPPRVLPPSAGGPAHAPGTAYVNPKTGERRFMDINGRWQGPQSGGGHGFTSEPPASWDRISQALPTSMADFLLG